MSPTKSNPLFGVYPMSSDNTRIMLSCALKTQENLEFLIEWKENEERSLAHYESQLDGKTDDLYLKRIADAKTIITSLSSQIETKKNWVKDFTKRALDSIN